MHRFVPDRSYEHAFINEQGKVHRSTHKRVKFADRGLASRDGDLDMGVTSVRMYVQGIKTNGKKWKTLLIYQI